MPLTVYTIIVGNWTFSDSACEVIGFINMFTLVSSVMSLCNISINRFFMVCRPTKFKDVYTTRNAVLMIFATVICSILLSSPPLFGWSEYVYTSTHSFCFADWVNQRSYAYFMIGCCFGIPFTVMTVCNIFIIRSVRESSKRVISTYKTTTRPSIVNSEDIQEIIRSRSSGDQKDPIVNKTDQKNNTHNPSTAIKDDLETMQMDRESEVINTVNDDVNIIVNAQTRCSLNADAVSISFSSESSSGLLKSGEGRGLKRMLLSGRNEHRQLIKSILITERENVSNPKQSIVKRSSFPLLHKQQPDIQEYPVSNDSVIEKSISAAQVVALTPDQRPDKTVRRSNTTNLRRREEIRLAVSLIIVVLLFVICWLPYCISMLLFIHYREQVPRHFHMFALLIGYANSGCNPIIYGVMNQRFKVGFKRLFCFWKPHRLSLSSNS